MTAISSKILNRIKKHGRGWVFTPKDFLDLANRASIDNVLSRQVTKGFIARVGKGVYHFPKTHKILGLISADNDSLAKAIAGKTNDLIFPSGAYAANLIGLSTQVPAKVSYLTNGKSKSKILAGKLITLKHAKVPIMSNLSFEANLAIQALAYLGRKNLRDRDIDICAKKLSLADKNSLKKSASHVPSWIADTIHRMN
jgi:hypothetical protein